MNTVLDVIFRYGVKCGVGRDVSSLWRLVFKLRGVWGYCWFFRLYCVKYSVGRGVVSPWVVCC